MLDWKGYATELKSKIGQIGKLNPDVVKGYATIANAKTAAPKLDAKTRELISLAVAVTTRCDGCIVTHTDAAKRAGATKEEIVEALGVAVALNAGAALVYSARVVDAYDGLE
jgi:alkylhydroperoxidase AhpD family core domain